MIHPQVPLISSPLSSRFIRPTTFMSIARDGETSRRAHNTSLKSSQRQLSCRIGGIFLRRLECFSSPGKPVAQKDFVSVMRNEKTSEKAHTLPNKSPSKGLSNNI